MSGWTPQLTAALVGGVKALVLLVALVTVAALLIWAERRLLALWQDRYGPNRVGPFGLLQVVADMIKIFFKEDWMPAFVDRPVFLLAPIVVMTTTLLVFVVIPVAPGWGVAPSLNVGVLLFLALAGLGCMAPCSGAGRATASMPSSGACALRRRCSPTKCSWALRSWA